MADVGRSTATHSILWSSGGTPVVIAQLENWGAWQICIEHPLKGLPASPMFKEYVAGYREVASRPAYEADEAIAMDSLIARQPRRNVDLLIIRFILKMSSRAAARFLTRHGLECTHTTYRRWLEDAIDACEAL